MLTWPVSLFVTTRSSRPLPGILKSMVFVWPVAELESRIACRSEPGPLSFVLETTKVASSVRSSSHSNSPPVPACVPADQTAWLPSLVSATRPWMTPSLAMEASRDDAGSSCF